MAEICSERMARAAESQGHALQDHGIEASYLNFLLMNERRRCRQIAVATLEVVVYEVSFHRRRGVWPSVWAAG